MFRPYLLSKFFGKVSTSDSCNVKVVELDKERFIKEGSKVVEFSEAVPSEFTLSEVFHVKLGNGESLEVVLKEECVIKALYMDVEFYTTVGQEFCLVSDIMYAKTRTEAPGLTGNILIGVWQIALLVHFRCAMECS